MRYAQMRSMDVSNGEGIGVSLFVQGCHFHCENCFNSEAWDFSGGKDFNIEEKDKFLTLINHPHIVRVSILGGEPLAEENLSGVFDLVQAIYSSFPEKNIWLYTGYTFEEIMNSIGHDDHGFFFFVEEDKLRYKIISLCNVVVDGRYVDKLKDPKLHWKGSSNQRVIDVQRSLYSGNVILYN